MKISHFKKPLFLICSIISIISGILLYEAFSYNHNLRVVFLDVGQGDSTLIQTPSGKNIIIDTGPRNNIGDQLSKYISDSYRVIDVLILTHPDLDHIGGTLSVLKNFKVKKFMHSGLLAGIPLYRAIAETISQEDVFIYEAKAGQRIIIEPDMFIDIYSPHDAIESFDANEYSIVMHVHYKDTSILLTGDASKINESDIVEVYEAQLRSDILKVGHHGSQTSTLDSFVQSVNPSFGIISAGCNNRFGHPHPNVLATLFKHKVEILETCTEGDIVFESDGVEWIRK